jgi:hypothetical protein
MLFRSAISWRRRAVTLSKFRGDDTNALVGWEMSDFARNAGAREIRRNSRSRQRCRRGQKPMSAGVGENGHNALLSLFARRACRPLHLPSRPHSLFGRPPCCGSRLVRTSALILMQVTRWRWVQNKSRRSLDCLIATLPLPPRSLAAANPPP